MASRIVFNIPIVRNKLLKFDNRGEFYIIEALCRPKKDGASTLNGTTNNHTRMMRMWTVYSREEFDKVTEEIVRICDANNARAYILPQRRTTYGAMKAIMVKALESLEDEKVNFNRFILSTLCGDHSSCGKGHRRWVFDIDADDPLFVAYARARGEALVPLTVCKQVDRLYNCFKKRVADCHSGDPEDVVVVETVNGWHIVTPPFNMNKCDAQGLEAIEEPFDFRWRKEDAMTLLYAPASKEDDAE